MANPPNKDLIIHSRHSSGMSLLTGREALLMSEPDDDMLSRLDQECRSKNET